MNPQKPKRITWAHIVQSLLETFNLEKGILYTLKNLLLSPGETLRTYLFEDRTKLTKPFTFFILTTTLAVLTAINLDPFSSQFIKNGVPADGEAQEMVGDSTRADTLNPVTDSLLSLVSGDSIPEKEGTSTLTEKPSTDPPQFINEFLQEYFTKYMQVSYWVLLPMIALFSFLFFRKQAYFYPEHFVLNTYVASMQNLMYVVLVPLLMVFGGNTIYTVYFIGMVAYQIFAYVHIFTVYSKVNSTWKAIVVIILSYIFFLILLTIVLTVITVIYMKSQGA